MINNDSNTVKIDNKKAPKNRTIKVEINENIDWSKPDWSREKPRKFWDPSRKLLKSIRDYQKLKQSSGLYYRIRSKLVVIRYRFWSIITGAEIDLSCQIGGGLLIPHPNGIVIHPDSIIGINCLIFQQVTLAGIVSMRFLRVLDLSNASSYAYSDLLPALAMPITTGTSFANLISSLFPSCPPFGMSF